jgi:predicted Zn-dependent peptidase
LIDKETLPNGVRVVVEEIPSVRSVSLGIWVGTGSRYETPENNGISHFLEHMFFKGTKRYTARQLAEVFDGIGGQVNAFTSKEYTCYYAKVLDNHFRLALETLADMFFHSTFVPDELAKERKVVIEEIRMYEDTPDELVHDLVAQASFGEHPLGYNILGTEQTLSRFEREDLLQYIQANYTPDNTVVTVAGNVRMQDVLRLVEPLFQNHKGQRRWNGIRETPSFHYDKKIRNKQTEQAHICLATQGFASDTEQLYAMTLLNNALGGSMSSRLFQEIREERGMAYSVYSYHTAYRETGSFGIYVGTAPEQAQDVVDLIVEIVRKVAEQGITAEELTKGKEQVKGSLMLSLESTSSRMSRLGKNELILGRHISLDEMIAGIDHVTLDDIKEVAREVLSRPLALAAVGPFDDIRVPGQ